jgi:hypothetical protein
MSHCKAENVPTCMSDNKLKSTLICWPLLHMEVLGHQDVRRYWLSGKGVILYFASPEQPNTWKCAISESTHLRER